MVQWSGSRAKVQLKLANQRLRMLTEKKEALAKQARRDIADLIAKNRLETARLRVESLIQEDISVELLELLELYTETLLARFGMLEMSKDEPDPSVKDAVCAIVYAAPHSELKELQMARDMICHKLGREYSLQIINNEPACVPPRVLGKLKVFVPPPELVDAYMEEIAKGYGLSWRAMKNIAEEVDEPVTEDDDGVTAAEKPSSGKDGEPGDGEKPSDLLPGASSSPPAKKSAQRQEQDDLDALRARFESLKKR